MQAPTIAEIRRAREELADLVVETPIWRWRSDALERILGRSTEVLLKLELFQHSGSFKPRGALCVMRALSREQLARGVTAVSAGDHAMAGGEAARGPGARAEGGVAEEAHPARGQGGRD